MIRRIQQHIAAHYPDWKHIGGGVDLKTGERVLERAIPGPGIAWKDEKDGLGWDSKSGSVFADLVYRKPDGTYVAINLPRVNRRGRIIQEEFDAIRRAARFSGAIDDKGNRVPLEVYLVNRMHR